VQAGQLISVKNAAVVESQKKEYFSSMTQDAVSLALFNAGAVECASSDGSCLNDVEQFSDKESSRFRQNEVSVHKDSDRLLTERDRNFMSQKGYKDVGMLDNEASAVSAAQKTDFLNEVSEAVVYDLVAVAADSEDAALADGSLCFGRQEISALEMRQKILDSSDGMLVSANSRLLNSGQKLDDLSRGKRGHDLAVRVPDAVSESTSSDAVRDFSLVCATSRDVKSAANKLVISSEDAERRGDLDNITPVGADNIFPDRHSTEKQRSDIANNIENLQSWIHSANSDIQSNAASDDAGIPFSGVEQYADELRKKKLELDRLNTQLGELEKSDKELCRDERYRLVSVHAQLHGLSTAVNRMASKAVCILYQRLHCCNF